LNEHPFRITLLVEAVAVRFESRDNLSAATLANVTATLDAIP
jgi:hypothetical protein